MVRKEVREIKKWEVIIWEESNVKKKKTRTGGSRELGSWYERELERRT